MGKTSIFPPSATKTSVHQEDDATRGSGLQSVSYQPASLVVKQCNGNETLPEMVHDISADQTNKQKKQKTATRFYNNMVKSLTSHYFSF